MEPLTADHQLGHAPGPWTVGSANGDGYDIGIHGAEDDGGIGFIIADMCTDGYDADVQAANARLIAAAPDLQFSLRGLIALVELWMNNGTLDRRPSCLDPYRVALAKAEGRS